MDYIKKHKKIFIIIFLVFIIPIVLAYYYGNLKNLFNLGGKNEPKSAPSSKIELYKCPSTPDFCQNGKDIEKDGRYLGFGAILKTPTDIFASFNGTITSFTTILPPKLNEQSSSANKEKLNTVYIDAPSKNLRAIYYFIGESSKSGTQVKTGDKIGKIKGKISAYNVSLLFQIIKGDLVKGQLSKLTNKDFTF